MGFVGVQQYIERQGVAPRVSRGILVIFICCMNFICFQIYLCLIFIFIVKIEILVLVFKPSFR